MKINETEFQKKSKVKNKKCEKEFQECYYVIKNESNKLLWKNPGWFPRSIQSMGIWLNTSSSSPVFLSYSLFLSVKFSETQNWWTGEQHKKCLFQQQKREIRKKGLFAHTYKYKLLDGNFVFSNVENETTVSLLLNRNKNCSCIFSVQQMLIHQATQNQKWKQQQ